MIDWNKYAPFFSKEEFDCKCGCGLNNMTPDMMDLLMYVRNNLLLPMVVKSGSRCVAHNTKEGGTETSDHLSGRGTDIACPNSSLRFRILRAAIYAGCERIGLHKSFIHLGVNYQNPQKVVWFY